METWVVEILTEKGKWEAMPMSNELSEKDAKDAAESLKDVTNETLRWREYRRVEE